MSDAGVHHNITNAYTHWQTWHFPLQLGIGATLSVSRSGPAVTVLHWVLNRRTYCLLGLPARRFYLICIRSKQPQPHTHMRGKTASSARAGENTAIVALITFVCLILRWRQFPYSNSACLTAVAHYSLSCMYVQREASSHAWYPIGILCRHASYASNTMWFWIYRIVVLKC